MYKANITDTNIQGGRLIVSVLFFNDTQSFTDTFETNQYQNESWIGEQISRRLSHLNSLPTLKASIVIGAFHETPRVKTDREVYQEKAARYLKFMDVARMGIIRHDRPIIGELREWLGNNFKDEYVSDF